MQHVLGADPAAFCCIMLTEPPMKSTMNRQRMREVGAFKPLWKAAAPCSSMPGSAPPQA